MDKINIRDTDRRFETSLSRLPKIGGSKRNKELILKFKDYCLLINMSKERIIKYLYFFQFLLKVCKKDFDQVEKSDIERIHKGLIYVHIPYHYVRKTYTA